MPKRSPRLPGAVSASRYVSADLSREQYTQLRAIADAEGLTLSATLRACITRAYRQLQADVAQEAAR
jgi:hypothetical protein